MTKKLAGYQRRIVTDPTVAAGAPTIRGTGISVEQILARLAVSPDPAGLLSEHPELTLADVQAALAYARDVLADARVHAAAREQRFRRMLAVARHDDIDGDALLEELERDDAERRAGSRP